MTQELLNQINKHTLTVGIAGPGTGKTYTFKEIINSDEYKGKQILILSFINKLIDDLKKEFKDFPNVEVRTLHSFAKKQLGNVYLFEMLDTIISEDYSYIKEKSFDYQESLRENTLHLAKNNEAFIFYRERKKFYEQEGKIYSFDSSILAANILFAKNEDKIPKYDLILIDEFQDFNELEFDLIKILNKKNRIVVVGDDDQSLYNFKYAEPNIIRNLYNDSNNAKFSLESCRRCTEVIVNSVNNLISMSKSRGLLKDRIDKRFLYSRGVNNEKDLLSDKINKIDFLPKLIGNKLIYELSKKISQDIGEEDKRVLILAPEYYHQFLYNGLKNKNFNIINYELFSNEKNGKLSHRILIDTLKALNTRKTDNLRLRLILDLYLKKEEIKKILCKNKKIWNCLTEETQKRIDYDIELFKKAQKGAKPLSNEEIQRLNELFNLKNLISKMLCGFGQTTSKSIEVEIVTPLSSKGLSAELVYYLYIDNKELFGGKEEITDKKICEFLVCIIRARERLTLISKKDMEPKILDFLGRANINTIVTS